MSKEKLKDSVGSTLYDIQEYIYETLEDYEYEYKENNLNSDEIETFDKYKKVGIYLDSYLNANLEKSNYMIDDMHDFIDLANKINNTTDELNNKEFAKLVDAKKKYSEYSFNPSISYDYSDDYDENPQIENDCEFTVLRDELGDGKHRIIIGQIDEPLAEIDIKGSDTPMYLVNLVSQEIDRIRSNSETNDEQKKPKIKRQR